MNELLDTKTGIDLTDGDTDLYKELLNYFVSDTEFDVKKLNDLILESKEQAAGYVHKVKGAARQIAAAPLAAKGQEIEDILRGKAEGNLAPLINGFCALYKDTLKTVNAYLKSE
ncbi:MAG: Hpt domain-containing protein [Treponema sp.]|uniref:Hpt domain-containing protein n=1 Tax=Treponema sp. TaxID=166 RepID=UPI001B4BBBF7|nr:Hpt domain-containing protein [Treponema sp.]MBP5403170.1 Hpt domain-containing protein [Treponema sp.]MBR5934392.1 Hpt domain-containing protein [Treponema sp.]